MIRGGRRLSVGLVIATIALGASAAIGGLGAVGSLEPERARVTILRQTHDRAVAKCTGGTDVVAGGFAAPDREYAGGGPYTEILATSRKSADRFVVKADNFSHARGELFAYAYCGHLGPVKVAEGRSREIEDFEDGSATARCPKGLTAVSGGWYGTAPRGRPQFVPYVSKRAGTDGWKVAAQNLELKGSATLVAQAYCADVAPPDIAVNRVRLPNFNQGTDGVNCAPGLEAVAGGFDLATRGGHSVGSEVYSSHRTRGGTRWKVAVINGRDPRPARIFAYCA